MRRNLARSRALLLLLIAALLLSPALVATSADAAGKAPYRVGIKLSDTNVTVGETVRVSGKVRPVTTGKVTVQRRVSGNWTTLKRPTLSAGSYSATVKFNDPGVAFLRVVVPASNGNKKGTSKTRTVRILDHPTNPQIVTPTLPAGAVGTAYSATVSTADARAGTWSIGAGALPPGLSIAPATGVISGTPTTAGTSQVGVHFKDSDGRVAGRVYNITITNDQLIVTTTLPNGVKGTAYTATLQSKDNRPGTWSITVGTLPAGLTLAPATGVISGTPTTVGKADFTVRFQDTNSNASTRALSITVTNTPPVITTTTLPMGKVDTAYTATLTTADNRAGTWSITTGTLPAGLTLAPTTGVISGTPTTRGTSAFTVKFKDADGLEVTKALSIQIQSCFLIFCS